MAGEGAIARKHLDALARIDGVEVVSLVGGSAADTQQLAAERGIPFWSLDLDAGMNRADVDAVVLTTPTQLHAVQAVAAMEAGKHVLIEIPMADSLAGAEAVVAAQERVECTLVAGDGEWGFQLPCERTADARAEAAEEVELGGVAQAAG